MKAAELRQKDVAGVKEEVKALQKAHFGLRMQKGTQQLNHAHDETGEFHLGDLIEITESKPISKTKNWVATRLVEKAAAV